MLETGSSVVDTASPGLRRFSARALTVLERAMKSACVGVQTKAKRRLKWRTRKGAGEGGRATGALSRRIVWDVKASSGSIEGRVGTGVKYARYVEGWNKAGEHKPVRRHYVPFTTAPGLKRWLQRHGIEVPRSAKGWVVGGPDSITPFLEPALNEEETRFRPRLERALRRAIAMTRKDG